ncbi:MAG: hypothetical protein P4M08_00960 [Oligoflexia bacterium]|nr:hypothetical protein [Oligoflexia bacterium]
MRVLRTHVQLRIAAACSVFAVPFSVLGVWLARADAGTVVRWASKETIIPGVSALVMALIVGALILKGRKLGVYIFLATSVIAILTGTLRAFVFHDVALGLYLILSSALAVGWSLWTLNELERSFFDPRLRWFQGLPKPIPGIECEIGDHRVRVSRLDREGAFVYSDRDRVPDNIGQISFVFRDRRINCHGVAVRTLDRVRPRSGVGIQFREMSADSRKVLGDFVESLKGEGYV